MADKLIPDYRRRGKLIQPNLTRSRAAYRSPIDSEMLNLEAEQIRFDLSMLRAQLETVKEMIEDDLQLVLDGGSALGGYAPATPVTRVAEALAAISGKVEEYDKRIKQLEILRGLR